MSLYSDLKNHIHNTLGITKDNIREMVEVAVERIVERRLDALFKEKFESQYSIDHIIDKSIERNLTKNNWYYGESEDSLDDHIKKEVVKKLLEGVKLKVEVSKTKRDATPVNIMTVKERKLK